MTVIVGSWETCERCGDTFEQGEQCPCNVPASCIYCGSPCQVTRKTTVEPLYCSAHCAHLAHLDSAND